MTPWIVALALLINTPLFAGGDENEPPKTHAKRSIKKKVKVPTLRSSISDITMGYTSDFCDRVHQACQNEPKFEVKFYKFLREISSPSERSQIAALCLAHQERCRPPFALHQYAQLLDLLPPQQRQSQSLDLIESCLPKEATEHDKNDLIQALIEMQPEEMMTNLQVAQGYVPSKSSNPPVDLLLRVVSILPPYQKKPHEIDQVLAFLNLFPKTEDKESLLSTLKQIDPYMRMIVIRTSSDWVRSQEPLPPLPVIEDVLYYVGSLTPDQINSLVVISRATKQISPPSIKTTTDKIYYDAAVLDLLIGLKGNYFIQKLISSDSD